MDKRLNNYLEKKDATALDDSVLEAYSTSMKEQVTPEIERQIRKNERRAAEQRFSPRPIPRRQKAVAEKKRKRA